MIQCFSNSTFTSSFENGTLPHLLSASYITIGFSQHSRILHNHKDRFELLFIRNGSGSYIVDDEIYDVEAGNLIVCNAGVLHDEVPQYNHELSMLSIAIDQLKLPELPENHLISDDIIPVLKVEKHFVLIDAIFQTLFDSLAFEGEEHAEANQYLVQALLALLVQAFKEHGETNPEYKKKNPLLTEIRHYINDNYSEDLSLQKISDHFYISPSYLSHLFKEKMGFSPMHYVIRRRIGEAQSLLIMSKKSITEIASTVGFDNLSHFNVQFKKYVGLSPLSYRKKYTLPDVNTEE